MFKIYLKTDVISLAYVFEKLEKVSFIEVDINPWY